MINVNEIVGIGGVLVGVLGSMLGIVPILQKKNINADKILATTEQTLIATEPLIKVAETIPTLKPAALLVDWIETKAKAGVKKAEQLYHDGQLKTNEERFTAAQSTVYAALKELKIEPTDNQKQLINDFIQEAVNDLGHAPVTEAQKAAQLQQAQAQATQLSQENIALKQVINTIQNTAVVQTQQVQ